MWKILVVDDSQIIRALVKTSLTRDNKEYQVIEADSGKMVFEVIKNDIPDLILLDVNMPDMSGFEVCRILRKDSIYKSLPIVFVTGAEDTASKIKGLEVGGNDYIIKPVRHEQLIQIVKAHLKKKRTLVIDNDKETLENLSLFLNENGFDTPQTFSPRELLAKKKLNFPYFLKPWDGYASRGNAVVKNREELAFFAKRIPHCIVQEFVKGTEYTCDVFVDFDMKVRCVVPRMRIETRSGEVSKGQIVKNTKLMAAAAKVVELLGAGPGVITIQCFLTKRATARVAPTSGDGIKFIEINPRFGGGAPLAIEAGADFPKWILGQLTGQKPKIVSDGFEDKLFMLRYDSEVWLEVQ